MRQLTPDDKERFKRHLLLDEVGVEGQKALYAAKVCVIGLGGLGSPVSIYLAAAGIGTIGLVDGDKVELSNLQRQIIHYTSDLGRMKVLSAKEKIEQLDPGININLHATKASLENISEIISQYDFVIDATDNIESKFLINDSCVKNRIPFSHGGIFRFSGQAMTILPGKSACYRCAYPEPPAQDSLPSGPVAGPMGPVAGIIGTIQAMECIKYILGINQLLTNTLLVMDAKAMEFDKIKVSQKPSCKICYKG